MFDLSASDNLTAPSLPILLAVLSKNQIKQPKLQPRWISTREEFDVSTSNNLAAPSSPIELSVLSEDAMKLQVCYFQV
jgi:hypothetical protein